MQDRIRCRDILFPQRNGIAHDFLEQVEVSAYRPARCPVFRPQYIGVNLVVRPVCLQVEHQRQLVVRFGGSDQNQQA